MATQSAAQRIQHIDLTKALKAPKRDVYNHIGNLMVSSTQKKIATMTTPKNTALTVQLKGSSKPLRDTGKLMASINHRPTDKQVVVGTNKVGARILHEGGKIKPVRAKHLTFPATRRTLRFMKKYGYTPRKCIQGMKRDGYKVYRSKKGRALMVLEPGKKKPYPLFVLRDSVFIQPRPYLTITQKDREVINKYVARMVVQDGR